MEDKVEKVERLECLVEVERMKGSLVEKDEAESKWSEAWVGRASEVGTVDKIPTEVPTIWVRSEGWTSLMRL